MEIITSKSNSKIIEAKKLLDKKNRIKSGMFLAETKKVIVEALCCNLTPVCLFVAQGKESCFNGFEHTYFVSQSVIKEISSTVTNDGYVAVFEMPKQIKSYNGGRFLILDNLQNPDNFGAIMRTALACDFKQIFCINCVDAYNPKTIRASMGNQFKLNIVEIDYQDVSVLFDKSQLCIADMQGKNLFGIKEFEENLGFVIGNEGNGVSDQLKSSIKNKIALPMQNGVESLNASICASVVMYYIYGQNFKK